MAAKPSKPFGGRWKSLGTITEGGQGQIHKVQDLNDEITETCILKKLKDNNRIGRFESEIKAYEKLEHPGIPRILDYSLGSSEDPRAYYVTKHFGDTSLTQLVQNSVQIDPLQALDIFVQICDIVAYAHENGVIHRDLKPDNIMYVNGEKVVVLDFGLCYFVDEEDRLTETMEAVGSRYYTAPELEGGRARSSEVTSKCDSYSLGKILYFLLVGEHLVREGFTGDNDLATITNNPQLQYVTSRILRESVVESPGGRLEASELGKQAERIHTLIYEHYYPGFQGTKCRFCGEGTYRNTSLKDMLVHTIVERQGRRNSTEGPPQAYICDNCGNIQWFAPDIVPLIQKSREGHPPRISQTSLKILR